MGWDRKTWRMNVSGMLFEMSNTGFQEAIWQAKIPGLMHSFSELVCNISDYAIPEGLPTFIEMGITDKEEAEALQKISDKVDSLLEKHADISAWTADEIIRNKEWLNIVDDAKKLFKSSFLSDLTTEQKKIFDEWWSE